MTLKLNSKFLKEMVEQVYNETRLKESQNTLAADINEIAFGFFALGGTWEGFENASEAKPAYEKRLEEVGPEISKEQQERAKVMVEETIKWANSNGFDGKPIKAWWTARPGVLSRAVGYEVDSRKNPTDILLQFSDKSFLGVSAKSTKGSGDIGFKNPGIGSLSKAIGVNLLSFVEKKEEEATKKYKLPLSKSERKQFIRSNPELVQKVEIIGKEVLNTLRDSLFEYYKKHFNNESFLQHIKEVWLDASGADPYYIKVTGHGQGGKYHASIHDPVNNEKLKVLSTEGHRISMTPVGNDSIGVHVGKTKIMKMRFKYESQKLASSIKLSGDPW